MPNSWLLVSLIGLATLGCHRAEEPAEFDPVLEAAIVLYREEGAEKALPEFERLATEFAASKKSRDEAAAIHYIGECHWRLGNFEKSRQFLDRALTLHSAARDRRAMGKTINSLGLLEWDLGNYDEAQARFRRAGMLARQVGDRKLEGATINNLGLVLDELGDYKASLARYEEALVIYRDVEFPRGLGDTLGNVGGVSLLLGRYQDAFERYQQALKISETLKSKPSMSQDHGNIALCLMGLGDIDRALEHFDQAIALAAQAGMRQDEAYWMRGKANGLIQKGNYDRGLELYRATLAIYDEVKAQAELVEALHDMGRLYILLGDPDSAERSLARGLAVARSIGFSRGVTQSLLALGDLQFTRERLDAAKDQYQAAYSRATESDEKHLVAASLLRLALVHREKRQLDQAAREISQALDAAREIGSRAVEAEALFALGEIERRRARLDKALSTFTEAEQTAAQIGDPDLMWQIHYGRALTQVAKGDKEAAIRSLVAAVTVIEGVRSRLKEDRFRAGYIQDKYEVYVDLVRLQLELGRTDDAFQTAERLRARNYTEQLGGRSQLILSVKDRREEDRIRERIQQLQRALADEQQGEQPSSRQVAIATVSSELQLAEKEYESFLDNRNGNSSRAASVASIPRIPSVQARLKADEALLEYVVGRDGIVAFVVTPRGAFAKLLPIARSDLAARIELLRDLLSRPESDRWLKPAQGLSALLVAPVENEHWLDGVVQLYVVPHGVLNYLPFSLLPRQGSGDRSLLIDAYNIAFLPTAAVLLREARKPNGLQSLLAMSPSRSRLRYAPDEVRSIDELFRPRSEMLLGNDATESRFKSLAGKFGVLHLATHGQFNKLNPLLSGLELEADGINDGMLQVHEVLGLRLNADLVTLSACDTGLASGHLAAIPAGDEFIGMTRAFLSAGSSSVVATLWGVDDRSSGRLMRRFYEHLADQTWSGTKASALAQAQRELRSEKRYSHPYFWAPFIVVGAIARPVSTETAI